MTPEIYKAILTGIVFGALNFWFLIRVVKGLVQSEKVSKTKTTLFLIAKMALLFLTIGLILWKRYVSPLPFVGGFTVSLIGGIVWQILSKKESTHA